MTVESYENQGGFREELQLVRDIGQRVTTLIDRIPARPHREPEMQAVMALRNALDVLRDEIARTRRG